MLIKVISFNIRCCDDKNGNSISERAPRLIKVTSPYDADVIGFQELRPAWEEYIEKYYLDKYDIYYKYRHENEMEAAPILWKKEKYDCLKKGMFYHSDTPEIPSKGWDEKYDCYRVCMYVILREKQSGKEFLFMNTHFGFGDNCHVESAKLIKEYSSKIADLPTFISGDFNMTPKSKGYEEITKYFTDVNAVCENHTANTYHGYDLSVERDTHIDFVFAGEGVKPLCQKIIDETVDGMFPSDHFGLYSELDI